MSDKKYEVKISGGLWTALLIIFVVLKLANIGVVATWSWWWVLSPLWIPFGIAVASIVLIGIILILKNM